jgi:hypothetical protein
MVQLISNYPLNFSCLLGFPYNLIFEYFFFIVKTFGQISIITILTTRWPPGPICI